MKCYLHIGTEKTATTTIQHFLDENRVLLSKYGYGYTKSLGEKNNRELAVTAYNPNRKDEYIKDNQINTKTELVNRQKEIVNKLKKEVSSCSESVIIFSSEHIQSRLTSDNEVQRLREVLIDIGFTEILIIVYLRNPPEIANSLYSTAIKTGSTASCPPNSKNPYYNRICNHKRTIESFGNIFGKENIIPRIFEKTDLVNESIIQDFIHTIGSSWSDQFILPENKNESISILGLEIFRRFNEKVPRFINNKRNPLRGDIVKYFEKYFGKGKYIMPLDLWREYEYEFHESNEWVRKNYFPNRKSLFGKKEYPKESKLEISEVNLESIANMISDLWMGKVKNQKKQLLW